MKLVVRRIPGVRDPESLYPTLTSIFWADQYPTYVNSEHISMIGSKPLSDPKSDAPDDDQRAIQITGGPENHST